MSTPIEAPTFTQINKQAVQVDILRQWSAEEKRNAIIDHGRRVAQIMDMMVPYLPTEMHYESTLLVQIHNGVLLHDIGKFLIPAETLTKPWEELTEDQKQMIDNHPLTGLRLLKQVKCPLTIIEKTIILFHHAYPGFPLKFNCDSDNLPLDTLASLSIEFNSENCIKTLPKWLRWVTAVDAFEAYTSNNFLRSYRNGMLTSHEVIRQMENNIFGIYDSQIVGVLKLMQGLGKFNK